MENVGVGPANMACLPDMSHPQPEPLTHTSAVWVFRASGVIWNTICKMTPNCNELYLSTIGPEMSRQLEPCHPYGNVSRRGSVNVGRWQQQTLQKYCLVPYEPAAEITPIHHIYIYIYRIHTTYILYFLI